METKMRLNAMRISGYKSYSDKFSDKIMFGDVNVIIGANGAGKSNFISFFDLLSHMMTKHLQGYVGEQGQAHSLLYYGPKKTEIIKAQIVFEETKNAYEYNFELKYSINDKLIFNKENISRIKPKGSNIDIHLLDYGEGHLESGLFNSNDQITKLLRTTLFKVRVFHFNDTTPKSKVRIGGNIDDNKYLRDDAGNLAAFLYRLKYNKDTNQHYLRIVKFIQSVMPQLEDFILEQSLIEANNIKLNWTTNNADELFGPHQLSDGTLRFIALATALLQPPETIPAIVIIDEPEIGLHPHAISLLAKMIKMASKYCQIILTTQSPVLLNEFTLNDIIVAEYDSVQNRSVLRKDFSEDSLKEWIERYSISELWEKNLLGGLPL